MTYQTTSASLILFDLFKDKTIDKEAKDIIISYIADTQITKNDITNIFNKQGVAIPIAFGKQDILNDSPPLFDDIFNIMFLRQIMKMKMGHCSVFTAISFVKDAHDVFKNV